MKKKNIIIIGILILVCIISFVSYKLIKKQNRKYEISEVKQYNYFLLKQNNLYGIIDKEGNTIIEAQYDEIAIPNPEKAVFVCYKDNNIKVLNSDNTEILTEYEKVEPIRLKNISSDLMYEKSVLKYSEKGKYGLINFEGKKVTKPIYEEIDSLPYKEGELIVKKDNKYGVININGVELVDINYEQVKLDEYYTDENKYEYAGYIVSTKTEEGYRYGYINKDGKLITKMEYNELSRVTDIQDNNNIYLICAKNGQYGVIKNEKELIPNQYQSIRFDESNNLFVVEKSKKYGIVNMNGNLIVPVEYKQIDITGIYLYAQNSQGTTIYNNEGNQVNIDENIAILNTSNEKYRIRINSKDKTRYGVIGKDGKQIIDEEYSYIEYLNENYFIVSDEKSKLGIIDASKNTKVEIKYDSIQKIQGTDMIQTSKDKKIEVYSKDMNKVCEMENAVVESKKDYIKVYNNEEIRYFDKNGNELKNTQVYPNNKLFTKEENGKWGFVDNNGNKIVDYKYDKVTEFNEYGFAAIKQGEKWGAINDKGEEVIAPTYELKGEIEPVFIGKYYRVSYGFGEFCYTNQ